MEYSTKYNGAGLSENLIDYRNDVHFSVKLKQEVKYE